MLFHYKFFVSKIADGDLLHGVKEENEMTLMRAFSKVDKDGKVKVPGNIQRAAELKEGQLVELRIVGASAKKSILITARKSAR